MLILYLKTTFLPDLSLRIKNKVCHGDTLYNHFKTNNAFFFSFLGTGKNESSIVLLRL